MKKFTRYFDDIIEYPNDLFSSDIMPMGTLYDYISHSFLDGLINHVLRPEGFSGEFKTIYVNRYYDEDDLKEFGTKQELLANMLKKPDFHTQIHKFRDDVVFLINKKKVFWVFYYDMDVSDCMIGRFRTEDNFDEVYFSMCDWVKEMNHVRNYAPVDADTAFLELPKELIRGWIGW